MAESKQTINYAGRGKVEIPIHKLEEFIRALTHIKDDRFRVYPEVIGGINVIHQNFKYETHTIHTFSKLMTVLESKGALNIHVSGTVEGLDVHFSFFFNILKNSSELELTLQTIDVKSRKYKKYILKSYNKLFPFEPYTAIDKFLLQRGFEFRAAPKRFYMPNYRELKSSTIRQQLKSSLGADMYGYEFEKYCASLAENELFWDTRLNVKLLNEGSGGDYDVLALSGASNDLIYIEAKTGHQLDEADFKNILKRHNFLRPAFTIIVVDLSKQYVRAKRDDFINAVASDYQPAHSPAVAIIKEGKSLIISAHRNIFLVSNEDIQQALSLCMRYYDGVIRQTSYYS